MARHYSILTNQELPRNSSLPENVWIVVGANHRLADAEVLGVTLNAVIVMRLRAGIFPTPPSLEVQSVATG